MYKTEIHFSTKSLRTTFMQRKSPLLSYLIESKIDEANALIDKSNMLK